MNELEFLEVKRQNYNKTGTVYNSDGRVLPRKIDLRQEARKVIVTLPNWQQMTMADVILNSMR